jgi:hypothetical protein
METEEVYNRKKRFNSKIKANITLNRWMDNKQVYTDRQFFELHRVFSKYKYNIYHLNHCSLKIQHAYFKWKAGLTKIIKADLEQSPHFYE